MIRRLPASSARLLPIRSKELGAALRGLEDAGGDLKALEGELAGFVRLRVGHHRIIVQFLSEPGQRVARCVYAERRSVIYELFAEILRGE